VEMPLAWLANELSRTGIGLKAGQTISTGTLTGMLRPKAKPTLPILARWDRSARPIAEAASSTPSVNPGLTRANYRPGKIILRYLPDRS